MQNKDPLEFCADHNQLEPCPACAGSMHTPPSPPRKHQLTPALITDRELAIAVRAALLAIVDVIERRYNLKKKP